MQKTAIFLTLTGRDRPGIIASITKLLYREGCNLEDISMTLLDGQFSMMLVFEESLNRAKKIDAAIKKFEKITGLTCFWKRQVRQSVSDKSARSDSDQSYFLIRAIGPDKTGIVFQMSQLLANEGLNITDLNTRVIRGSSRNNSKPIYALLLETPIPRASEKRIQSLRKKLQSLGKRLSIDVQLNRVESLSL